MNVIIFNYRGYGRSSMSNSTGFFQNMLGVMNPTHVMQDAEIVLEYAREKYIQQMDGSINKNIKVIVHGESMGGMVATYVAMRSSINKQIPVDFAYINRTFAALDAVAYWSSGITMLYNRANEKKICMMGVSKFSQVFGKFVSRVFRVATMWKDANW